MVDRPAECARAVREQLRRNAKLIKIFASGGVMSEVDNPIHQQFTDAAMRAMVEVAGLAERVVAAYCHGKPGLMAGFDADVIIVDGDPLSDISVLAEPARITGVFTQGRRVKTA